MPAKTDSKPALLIETIDKEQGFRKAAMNCRQAWSYCSCPRYTLSKRNFWKNNCQSEAMIRVGMPKTAKSTSPRANNTPTQTATDNKGNAYAKHKGIKCGLTITIPCFPLRNTNENSMADPYLSDPRLWYILIP